MGWFKDLFSMERPRKWRSMPHEFGKTLKLAAAAIPPEKLSLSIVILGSPGSGKSSIYKYFYKSASWLNQSGVLLDVSGEMPPYMRAHCKPGAWIAECDPFVMGGMGIDFAKALQTFQQWQNLSYKMRPENDSERNPFFSKGTRLVIQNTCRALCDKAQDRWSLSDLIKIMMNRHLFSALAEQCDGVVDIFATTSGSDGGRDLAGTVMAVGSEYAAFASANDSCRVKLDPFWALQGPNRWMILVREPKAAASVEATHAFLLEMISEEANTYMGKNDIFHIGGDEIRNYPKIEKVSEGIRIGRKSRVVTCLTLHDINGLIARYGKEEAMELIDQCDYKIITRTTSQDSAEWASKVMGDPLSLRRIRKDWLDPDKDQLSVEYIRNVTVDEIQSLPLASWENDQIRGYLAFPNLKCQFRLKFREHVAAPPPNRVYRPADVQLLPSMTAERVEWLGFEVTEKVKRALKGTYRAAS